MPIIIRLLIGVTIALYVRPILADSSTVYEQTIDKPVAEVYRSVYKSLEQAKFFVIFEPNIGANLAGFAKKWGDDYNRNELTAIRSLVFCNGWYANQVSNKDPAMLGLCPLHMTLYEKNGRTTALFNRPTVIAKNSPAHKLLQTVEQEVIAAIKKGMQSLNF